MANDLKMGIGFEPPEPEDEEGHQRRMAVLASGLAFNPAEYEFSDRFVEGNPAEPMSVHTLPELVECLKENPQIKLDARILGRGKDGNVRSAVTRETFIKLCEDKDGHSKLRESVDSFATDQDAQYSTGSVGDPDFVPLLGGPFYKQLYYYDYIRMHARCFYAFNHDPIGKRVVGTTRDFTLGREWKVEFKSQEDQVVWDAFCIANDFQNLIEFLAVELGIYGEVFLWWLPGNATKIAYDVSPGQEPKKGILPRVRLVDPSVFWEIVTYPEDITRVLYYQWIAPTQYQYYSGQDKGSPVGISKFIYQQIPASEIDHFRVNSVSNEKRGRSDLFPALGYMKRLRDSVNYSIIGLQKAAAWGIDTEIDGSPQDIMSYVQDQQAVGTTAPAGSEFIHSTKVKRNYLSNSAATKGSQSSAFDWCLSMIAAGTGIPVAYLGTHLSGAQTRASAMVATEPVAKQMETRQGVYKRVIDATIHRLFKGAKRAPKYQTIFPELIVQDRSAKLLDLSTAETRGWISHQRAAEIAAKELGVSDYNYEEEQRRISKKDGPSAAPLTTPGQEPGDDSPKDDPTSSAGRRALRVGRGA